MASKSKSASTSADAEWIKLHAPYVDEPVAAKLTTAVEPHARYQQIIKELAQARLDKKKKKSRS
tara:strand:- start:375 stop:566 length:192 start_codon:yes stop_codon:yes gene_type:complete